MTQATAFDEPSSWRRHKEWERNQLNAFLGTERPEAESLRPYLYRLPFELFLFVMEHLDFRDIFFLCRDPDFPVHLLCRRHIENDGVGNSIVHVAAKVGWTSISMLKKFMNILGDWDIPGQEHLTPLGLAAACDNYDLCEVFLEAGAQVECAESGKELAPLWWAAQTSRNSKVISLLIDNGADTWWAFKGMPVIHVAAQHGSPAIVDLLLRNGADANAIANSFRKPLHMAKKAAVARVLLAHGADVNAKDSDEATPLVDATLHGDPVLVAILLNAGAEVNIYNHSLRNDQEDLSPLSLSIQSGRPEIVEMILNRGYQVTRRVGFPYLHMTNNPSIVKLLLTSGADINARDGRNATMLEIAARSKQFELVEILLMAGAEFDPSFFQEIDFLWEVVNASKYTIVNSLLSQCSYDSIAKGDVNLLSLAISLHYEGIARLLIKADAQLVNLENESDESPLYLATDISSLSLVRELINAGAEMEYQGPEYRTPLFNAVISGREDAVQLLIDAGADSWPSDKDDIEPAVLLAAGTFDVIFKVRELYSKKVFYDSPELRRLVDMETKADISMLEILLPHTDISETTWKGFGILHFAVLRNDEDLIETLLDEGANPCEKDLHGYSPAVWAFIMGYDEIAIMLRDTKVVR